MRGESHEVTVSSEGHKVMVNSEGHKVKVNSEGHKVMVNSESHNATEDDKPTHIALTAFIGPNDQLDKYVEPYFQNNQVCILKIEIKFYRGRWVVVSRIVTVLLCMSYVKVGKVWGGLR